MEVSKAAVRQYVLTNQLAAFTLAEAADGLYQEIAARPFSGEGVDILAAYADQRLDISDERLWGEAEALEAILDREYPDGRHRADLMVARWRLQLLAELSVGTEMRRQAAMEETKVTKLKRVTHGTGSTPPSSSSSPSTRTD